MNYKTLLEITSQFTDNGAYDRARRNLKWDSPHLDMASIIATFEGFLADWKSLRRPIGREEMKAIWTSEVEPYAKALELESLESLDVNRIVEVKEERLKVGIAIEHIYTALSTVPGIGETNASKLLHLRLPNLFVMTDAEIRNMFKKLRHQSFEPYAYAVQFLPFVQADLNDTIHTLCEAKSFTSQEAIDFLCNSHNATRSLAKLMDECYYILAHLDDPGEHAEYYAALMRVR